MVTNEPKINKIIPIKNHVEFCMFTKYFFKK